MDLYKAVEVTGGMVGGHYAVEKPNGKQFGRELGLDQRKAKLLADELNDAYTAGKTERIGSRASNMPLMRGPQMASSP